MSTRMMGLLAVLLAVALWIVFDTPPQQEVVEVAQRRERLPMPPPVLAAPRAQAPGPVPDLFAGAGQDAASPLAQAEEEVATDGEPAAPAFSLLGFKEEGGVREAYLLRNGEVLVARAGAVFEQQYRVQVLRADTVHITDTRSGETLRIGYGEQE